MKTNKKTSERESPAPGRERKDACKCNMNCNCCEERKEEKKRLAAKLAAVTMTFLLLATGAFAQEPAKASFWTDPINSPLLPVYLTMAFLVITIVLLVLVIVYVMKVLNVFMKQAEAERAARLGIPVKKRVTWWEKLWQDANASVPLEKEGEIDTGHDYDGIRELDNHLPPWWTGLFYATIIWSVVYLVVYHLTNSLPLSIDEYQQEIVQAEEKARILKATQPAEAIDENTLEYKADPEILARGKVVFNSNNCASCHRADGGGNTIGPNLTDEYWIHGGSIRNIYATVNVGVVEKGMPAWGKVMSPRDVRDVSFYIMSLGGTKPVDAKAPQGQLYKPEPAPAAADSLTSQVIQK